MSKSTSKSSSSKKGKGGSKSSKGGGEGIGNAANSHNIVPSPGYGSRTNAGNCRNFLPAIEAATTDGGYTCFCSEDGLLFSCVKNDA